MKPAQDSQDPPLDFSQVLLSGPVRDDAESSLGVVGLIGLREYTRDGDIVHHADALVLEELADVLQHGHRFVVAGMSPAVGAVGHGMLLKIA